MRASQRAAVDVPQAAPRVSAGPMAVVGPGAARPTVSTGQAQYWRGGNEPLPRLEPIAAECPVALVYNGVSHAVMLASPADLEDMGIGFTIAEAVVANAAEIGSVEAIDMALGMEVRLEIPPARAAALDERRRSMAGGTACGLCGIISLDRVLRPLTRAPAGPSMNAAAVRAAVEALPAHQAIHRATGAVHAAAMASLDGEILLMREDVGRHNALDKLVGAAARAGEEPRRSLLVLTSRCSAEMVQKAATAGFAMIVAISAPTSLAVKLAEEANVTLAGFARGSAFTIYTHPERIRRTRA